MIDKETKRLMWLEALEAAGVDNWEGIDEAVDIYQDMLANLSENMEKND